jgi:hypothetical protein
LPGIFGCREVKAEDLGGAVGDDLLESGDPLPEDLEEASSKLGGEGYDAEVGGRRRPPTFIDVGQTLGRHFADSQPRSRLRLCRLQPKANFRLAPTQSPEDVVLWRPWLD